MNPRILFVDDDPNLLASFQRSFRKLFEFDTANGGKDALVCLKKFGPYSVIVSDMGMPGMDGLELLEKVRVQFPDVIRVMLTGNADQQTAVDAVNRGQIFRFINKPCSAEDLVPVINSAIEAFKLQEMERSLLENTLSGCVKVLAEILGMVSPESLGRGQRLRESMQKFAVFLSAPRVWEIELGAQLSTIGYASLPTALLQKIHGEGELSLSEAKVVRHVPRVGYELLIAIPRLKEVAEIVLYQNQHFDGEGFPAEGCEGEAIPLGARMLKIIVDRSLLETDGVVKKKALEVMKLRTGVYDPVLLEKCFLCFPEFLSNAVSAERPVFTTTVNQLKAGQVTVSDIQSRTGITLLGGGSRLTEMMLQRLRNYSSLGDVQEPILIQNSAEAPK
jgi:response regulator RpfG family c-di-GMP phosphodiesterase